MAGDAAPCAACLRLAGVLAIALAARASHASVPTLADCLEASDFIANAAHARDNGMHREAFLDRMRADFAATRAFPAALRWFTRDGDDEHFLLTAAADVFDRPRAPSQHRTAFLAGCIERAT